MLTNSRSGEDCRLHFDCTQHRHAASSQSQSDALAERDALLRLGTDGGIARDDDCEVGGRS